MASIEDLFGRGSVAQQFLIYGVLQQLIGGALAPAISDITQAANSADPVNPLSPSELAVAVVREIIDAGNGQSEAAKSGIGPGRFQELVLLAQTPPALGLILEAHRRSLGQGTPGGGALVDLDKALADLGISSQYRPMVEALAVSIPDQSQVLLAWLTGQIEPGEAHSRLLASGMDPTWIQSAYNAEGQAPTPNELLELWNRGIIGEGGTGPDAISYDQGYLEGPFRNKWAESYKALRLYFPPPRTTQALLREGSISEATAQLWLGHYGVEGDVLAAFMSHSTGAKSPAERELSKTEVLNLYGQHLLTAEQAIHDLTLLNYSDADARLLIAGKDATAAAAATRQAVTRLQHLYLAGTNTAGVTTAALHQLGLTDQQAANLISTWDLEQATVVKALTPAQVEAAWHLNLIGTSETLARLTQAGYPPSEAMLLLEIRNKGPLTDAQLGT